MPILENIHVRQEAVELVQMVYKYCKETKNIAIDYWLRDQLQRSSVSIASNIAEWNDRESNKEFLRFLYISRGSCSELKTQLYIVKWLEYISEKEFDNLIGKNIKIHKMLNGMIKSIKEKEAIT